MAISKRFHSFQRLKGTTGGRGKTKKLEPLERLKEKERNWVHTQNHLFSRDVITFALHVKAATIQMEDLSGYGKDDEGNVVEEKKFLLGKWSYYELQDMIKYKAKKVGMRVNFIKPAYSSQTCSWCGERGERNSTSFVCTNSECSHYGEDLHADYNAARNIARSKNIIRYEQEYSYGAVGCPQPEVFNALGKYFQQYPLAQYVDCAVSHGKMKGTSNCTTAMICVCGAVSHGKMKGTSNYVGTVYFGSSAVSHGKMKGTSNVRHSPSRRICAVSHGKMKGTSNQGIDFCEMLPAVSYGKMKGTSNYIPWEMFTRNSMGYKKRTTYRQAIRAIVCLTFRVSH